MRGEGGESQCRELEGQTWTAEKAKLTLVSGIKYCKTSQSGKEDLFIIQYLNILDLPFSLYLADNHNQNTPISISPIFHLSYISVTPSTNISDWPLVKRCS